MYLNNPPLRSRADYDVIVVGGRVAGAATAMLLAQRGMRVVVLDQSAAGSDALSTHALMRAGVLQLSRWGVLDDIVAAGTPPITRTTFTYAGERVVIDLKSAHGVDALFAPRRTLLDSVLVMAANRAGAEVHHRASVADVVRQNGRVVGVRAVTWDDRVVELRAPLVIGADGIRSSVARLVEAPFSHLAEHAMASSYGYWSNLPTDGYEWVFRADACSGVIPTNDGQACVFAAATPGRIGRGGVELIEEIVRAGSPEIAERLRRATPPRGTRTWSGHHGYIRRSAGPGWALVGDAGYFKDPISAHGLTDALRDAELLARAVVDGFGDDSNLAEALASYEDTRNRLSLPLFDIVDRIASQRWDDGDIGRLLIGLSGAMNDELEMLDALEGDPVS